MNIDKITAEVAKTLELESKAEWEKTARNNSSEDAEEYANALRAQDTHNRTFAPKAARALRIAVEALNNTNESRASALAIFGIIEDAFAAIEKELQP